MAKPPPQNQYFPGLPGNIEPSVRKAIEDLFDRVNFLIQNQAEFGRSVEQVGIESARRVDQLQIALASVQDAQTQGSTFASSEGISLNPTTQASGGGTGYTFTQNSAGVLTMSVSNAATARGAISAAQSGAVGAGTVTLAKLTPAGTDGSISYNADGCITAVVAPT